MFSMNGSGGDCDIEKEKPRLLPSVFPNFAQLFNNFPQRAFSIPGSSNSSTSQHSQNPSGNVFPMFPPNFNPYALMQQSQLISQLTAAKSGLPSVASDSSTSRSSTADSTSKKLQPDADGNICCPVCDRKFSSDVNWDNHLAEERKWLVTKIEKIRDQKVSAIMDFENLSEKSQNANKQREKRETELLRIRMNQQKRLSWKSISPLSTRNSEASSFASSIFSDKTYCKGCDRQHDYLVISTIIDEPRCLDCFQKYRKQMTFLPSSITESPIDESVSIKRSPSTPSSILNHTVDELLSRKRKNTSPTGEDHLVNEKQIKIEV